MEFHGSEWRVDPTGGCCAILPPMATTPVLALVRLACSHFAKGGCSPPLNWGRGGSHLVTNPTNIGNGNRHAACPVPPVVVHDLIHRS